MPPPADAQPPPQQHPLLLGAVPVLHLTILLLAAPLLLLG
jgi:hypothetical protein